MSMWPAQQMLTYGANENQVVDIPKYWGGCKEDRLDFCFVLFCFVLPRLMPKVARPGLGLNSFLDEPT